MMKTTLLIFLLSLSFTLCGCYTYYPSNDSPESLKVEKNEYIKITVFGLNNGDFINVSDYDVKYYKKYKSYENVFVCIQSDDIHKNEIFSNLSKTKKDEKIIPFENVKSVSIEKRKTDVVGIVLTVLISAATVAALFLILVGTSFHHIGKMG